MARYNHCSLRIRQKIEALNDRRPAAVNPKLWEESVGWLVTAHCNICFSEESTSYEAMCQFEEQLDEKLKGDVDLGTIEWIGDRLAETGPNGQRYMKNWKIQWNGFQEWWSERSNRRASEIHSYQLDFIADFSVSGTETLAKFLAKVIPDILLNAPGSNLVGDNKKADRKLIGSQKNPKLL